MASEREHSQPFDLILQEPAAGVVTDRIQRFKGFVQSSAPLPPLRFLLNGVEQRHATRRDAADPKAAVDRRHTSYFAFHCEALRVATDVGAITLDVYAGAESIGRRFFRLDLRRDRIEQGNSLVYMLHIPKTAGSSLRFAMEATTPDLRVLSLYNNADTVPPEQFRTFSPGAVDDLDVIFGHYSYGLHNRSPRPYRYLSILRRPETFFKSYYLFQKYVRQHQNLKDFATIDEAITKSGDVSFENLFVRMISGKPGVVRVGQDEFALACANIERDFAYVGLAEDMRATTEAIGAYLGVDLETREDNATPRFDESATIDPARLRKDYESRMAFDLRLYDYVEARFGRSTPYHLAPVVRRPLPLPAPPTLWRRARRVLRF